MEKIFHEIINRFSIRYYFDYLDLKINAIYLIEPFHAYDIVKDMARLLLTDLKTSYERFIIKIKPDIKAVNYKKFRPDARF